MARRTLIDFFDDFSSRPGDFIQFDDGYHLYVANRLFAPGTELKVARQAVVRVIDGVLRPKMKIRLMATRQDGSAVAPLGQVPMYRLPALVMH